MTRPKPTAEQIALASFLNLEISDDSFEIAAARIWDAVAGVIGDQLPEIASDRQRQFASSLHIDLGTDSRRVASAKIGEKLWANNQDAIRKLELKAGDEVTRVTHYEVDGAIRTIEQDFIVSTIQTNGRVFFKGGNGQGGWPTQLKKRRTS